MKLTASFPRIIKSHLEKNKLNHAYLLYGPGRKIKTAFEFARTILGQKLCHHPDFIILQKEEGATQIKIESVREVRRRVSLRSSGKRVVMIKKAELLSLDAANALLKTLEEPPMDTIFILTTANIREIIPTIISRCQNIGDSSWPKKWQR
ncbi:MAG: DNA polymerase III subunit delta' [Candidatus Berkelbacteria bacterium Licking1014_96]|uniref:DNA polymerase III subunit delta n=1 Tax=Candidatus Berkelbacteria bacterium Licking1014_96 TaxID=2017149 RepID=A0A554LE22_9BACT|nr:MAG: DNA polymerase III subunit delta' [Candidatus Berkelbacteria bacterium Licking1014_96]